MCFPLYVLSQCAKTITFGGYGVSVHLFPFRAEGVGSADNVKLSPPSLMILHLFKIMTDNKQLAKLEFVAFCIEQYKIATKQTGCEVEQLLRVWHHHQE